MNGDFLTRLVARETGRAPIVAPAVPPPFLPDTAVPAEIEAQGDDRPPTVPILPAADHQPQAPGRTFDDAVTAAPPLAPNLDRPSGASPPSRPPPAPPTEHVPAAPVPPGRSRSLAAVTEMVLQEDAAAPVRPPRPPDPAPSSDPEDQGRVHRATASPPADVAPAADRQPPAAAPPAAVDDRPEVARDEPPSPPDPPRRPSAADRSVRIHIGRIEVRAPAPRPATPAPSAGLVSPPPAPGSTASSVTHDGRRARQPSRSLDDYLRERRARR